MKVGRATTSGKSPTLNLLAAFPGCVRSQRVLLRRGACKLLYCRGLAPSLLDSRWQDRRSFHAHAQTCLLSFRFRPEV